MVIIRVGIAARANQVPLGTDTTERSLSAERRRRTQLHTMTLTESNAEDGHHSSMLLTTPISSKNHPSEIKFESMGEAM